MTRKLRLIVKKSGDYWYFETPDGKYIGKTNDPVEAEKIIEKYVKGVDRMERTR